MFAGPEQRMYGGLDCIARVPLDRWDVWQSDLRKQGQPVTGFAAWLADVANFDEGVFRLSQTEAIGMDPQCRLLLECVGMAVQAR